MEQFTEIAQRIIVQYGAILSVGLPWIQSKLNFLITEDLLLFKKIVFTQREQKVAVSFLLSAIFGIGLTAVGGEVVIEDLGTATAVAFAISQAIYHTILKEKK